jgi:hypothetical protein
MHETADIVASFIVLAFWGLVAFVLFLLAAWLWARI